MNYQESIDFLKSRTKFGINMGLSRIEELLRRLGNPHKKLQYIHVTGTNGKGSTCAMIASVCKEAGYRTGFFSSPHLHSYIERFRINGTEISEKRLAEILTQIAPHLTAMHSEGWEDPTEFEISTAVALLYFAEEQVDMAVMEVGMGGSIDSTNVIDAKIAVITSVAMDHMSYLGNTIDEIAAVKAGIIKKGSAVFTACQNTPLAVIRSAAQNNQAQVFSSPEDFSFQLQSNTVDGQIFDFHGEGKSYYGIKLSLLGRHQLSNAALAISVCIYLGVEEAVIKKGIERAVWPARLEIISSNPLILLDGAHNTEAFTALTAALREYWSQKRIVAVLGMLDDKNRQEALSSILPCLAQAVITHPLSERASDWQYLATICEEAGVPSVREENINKACEIAVSMVKETDLLLVCGSFFLVAAAREYFFARDNKC